QKAKTKPKPKQKAKQKPKKEPNMNEIVAKFTGGGYVNERNQLQENSGILFNLQRRRDSFEGVVFDGEKS
ncbi:MAG: hypothetical protein ABJA18_00320, partial [bacterium]